MRAAKLVAVLALALVCASCMHFPAGFAPATGQAATNPQILGRGYGAVTYFSLFGCIPFDRPNYDAAINAAVSNFPGGRMLINARSWETTSFVLIGTLHTLHVEGDVIK